MHLSLSIGHPPRDEDMVQAVHMVRKNSGEGTSLILFHTQMIYMQTDGVVLEYQDGSLDTHYFCPYHLHPTEMAKILCSYASEDDWWRTATPWQPGFACPDSMWDVDPFPPDYL